MLSPDARLIDREQVVQTLHGHAEELRRLGIVHLSLFGSVARRADDRDSDIDLLVDVADDPVFSLFSLGEVRVRLCELLGRDVDVVIAQDLGSGLRRAITRDLVPVF